MLGVGFLEGKIAKKKLLESRVAGGGKERADGGGGTEKVMTVGSFFLCPGEGQL